MSRAGIDQRILKFQEEIQSFFENYDSLNPNSEENKTIRLKLVRILRSFNPSPSTRNLLVSDLSLAFNSRNRENKSIQDIIIDAASVNKKAVPSLGFKNFSGNFQVFSSIVNIAMNRNKDLPIDIRLINSESFGKIRSEVALRLRAESVRRMSAVNPLAVARPQPPQPGRLPPIRGNAGVVSEPSERLPEFPEVPTHEVGGSSRGQEAGSDVWTWKLLKTAPTAPKHNPNPQSSVSAAIALEQRRRAELDKALVQLRRERDEALRMRIPGAAQGSFQVSSDQRRRAFTRVTPREASNSASSAAITTNPHDSGGRASPPEPEIREIPSSRRPSRLRNAWNSFKGLFKRRSARIGVGDHLTGRNPAGQAWTQESAGVRPLEAATPDNPRVMPEVEAATPADPTVGLVGEELEFYNGLSQNHRELFLRQSEIDRSTIISAINEGISQDIEEAIAFLNPNFEQIFTAEKIKISDFINSMQNQETKDQFEALSKENQLTVIAYFEEIEPRSGQISDEEIIDVISNIYPIDPEEKLRIAAQEELVSLMNPRSSVMNPSQQFQTGQGRGAGGGPRK